MVDISTGYFVMVTGGSFIFGAVVTVILYKLFGLKLPIKQSNKSQGRKLNEIESDLFGDEEDEESAHVYANIRGSSEIGIIKGRARSYGAQILGERAYERGESKRTDSTTIDMAVPPKDLYRLGEFLRRNRKVLWAYSNKNHRAYSIKTESEPVSG